MKHKRFLFLSAGMLMIVVTMLSLATQTVFAQQENVSVSVCHYNPGNGGVIVVVAVQSVNDANGLNGHGNHANDSWASFEFGGVTYPGQGDPSNCDRQVEDPEEEDLCSNIDGVQETLPDGYILNTEGLCVPEETEIDLCSNLDGIQSQIPEGYVLDNEGTCVPEDETFDISPNLEGDQSAVPAGMFINNDGQCVVDETPPPPSSSTTTSTTSSSTTRFLIPVTGVDLANSSEIGLSLAGLAAGLGMVLRGLTIKK